MDGGRAQVLGDPPAEPTVRLRLSGETFVRLGAGRGDAEVILGSGAVEVSGDAALGFTIARAMNFMF
jgi:hypothetical protein